MKTHTELLTELIEAVYASELTLATHPLKMITAEIKGQMMATCDHCDSKPFTQPNYSTPDADGWVENTGVIPDCEYLIIRFADKSETKFPVVSCGYNWENPYITHYKPA